MNQENKPEKEHEKGNPLIRVLDFLADVAILGILWTVCSLPIFTMGAATTACYCASGCLNQRKEGIWATFFQAFRSCFAVATGLEAILLIPLVLLLLDLRILGGMTVGTWLQWPVWVVLVGLVLLALVVFPMVSRYQNSLKEYLKNACFLVLLNIPSCMGMFLLLLVPGVAFALNPDMFLNSILPVVWIFWPGCYIYGTGFILRRMFKRHENTKNHGSLKADG